MDRPEPDLAPRFLAPPGLRWGRFVAADGASLRWARLDAAAPQAECILVCGFSEFVEKYFETISDFAARGLTTWCLDWRGQGGAVRPGRQPLRPEARDFDRDAADLAAFAASVLAGDRPRIVAGHSMGGAIALLALCRGPALFDAAVLSAPMLALHTGLTPRFVARHVAAAATRLGWGRAVVPGTRTWPVDPERGPAHSRTSGDAARCRVQPAWFAHRPDLRIDGVTFAWLDSALALCRRFEDPQLFAAAAAPVLLGSAGIDRFVDPAGHARATAALPRARRVHFPSAKHELFMEADAIRAQWLAEIDRFLAETGLTGGRQTTL